VLFGRDFPEKEGHIPPIGKNKEMSVRQMSRSKEKNLGRKKKLGKQTRRLGGSTSKQTVGNEVSEEKGR